MTVLLRRRGCGRGFVLAISSDINPSTFSRRYYFQYELRAQAAGHIPILVTHEGMVQYSCSRIKPVVNLVSRFPGSMSPGIYPEDPGNLPGSSSVSAPLTFVFVKPTPSALNSKREPLHDRCIVNLYVSAHLRIADLQLIPTFFVSTLQLLPSCAPPVALTSQQLSKAPTSWLQQLELDSV